MIFVVRAWCWLPSIVTSSLYVCSVMLILEVLSLPKPVSMSTSLHCVKQASDHAATEVKEYHRSASGRAAVSQQYFQNADRDHYALEEWSANGRAAPER